MMGPWETAPPQVEEEEIDIFAELGAMRPVETTCGSTTLCSHTQHLGPSCHVYGQTMTNHQC